MTLKKDVLFEQLNQEVNCKNRTIFLECEIDITIPSFISQRVDLISQITGDSESPITLELTSYGGDAYAALAVVDLIQSLPVKINIHGRGPIMSAGALILMKGTGTRSLSENSILMIHSVSSMTQGNAAEIINEANQIKVLNELLYKMTAESSNKPVDYWKKATESNCYLSAKEALEFGFIDEIK